MFCKCKLTKQTKLFTTLLTYCNYVKYFGFECFLVVLLVESFYLNSQFTSNEVKLVEIASIPNKCIYTAPSLVIAVNPTLKKFLIFRLTVIYGSHSKSMYAQFH